ncbi:hypothetical protein HYU11_01935 [Candidatus Woesearchaeota archaeon]|nr:hypothetical protein [Candidatus Woesearchaeota archaeon]
MQTIKELVELVKVCRKNCPWCREQSFESYSDQVLSEARELEAAIKEKDIANVKEELGDLLWDVIMLLHIAEHNKMFSSDEVIRLVNEKMKRRKPYIVSGEEVSLDRAMAIWNEQKAREKGSR